MSFDNEHTYWYNKNLINDTTSKVNCKLWGVVVVCCIFIIVEIIGSYISKSVAILTDAAHLVSDLAGFVFSLISIQLSTKKATLESSFGYARAEVLGSFASVIIIWGLTAWIFYEAILRWISEEYQNLNPTYMLYTSIIALGLNIIMGAFLHGCGDGHGHSHGPGGSCGGHGHSHGHSHNHSHKNNDHDHDHDHEHEHDHDHEHEHDHDHDHHHNHNHDHKHKHKDDKKQKNLSIINANENFNVRAAAIHIIGDMIQSVGVVIFSIIIYFNHDYKFLDPIISIIFSIIALSLSFPVTKSIIHVLMEKAPENLNISKFKKDLEAIKYVTNIHDLHVWNLTYGKPSMTAHIECSAKREYVLKKATLVCRKIGIYHSTIQVELESSEYKINCDHNVHD
jgi:zinc transporter 2